MLFITIFGAIFIHSAYSQAAQYSRNFGECVTPSNERSVCVFLNECGDLYNLLKRYNTLRREEDKIYLAQSQCGYQSNSILVCCPPRSPSRYPPAPSQPIGATPNSYLNQGGGGTESRVGESLLPQPGSCGIGSSDKIFGGNITKIYEFPWMCLLEYSKPYNEKGFHCGGSIITSRYVVTAAHCIKGKPIPRSWRLTSVRLGEWDTDSDYDCDNGDCSEPTQDVAIERAITHEQYNPNARAQYNDIALLRLVRNVVFTHWIKPICLPTANELRDTSFEGIALDVAGWGRTESGGSSRYKMKARVDGVPLQNCNEMYAKLNVELISSQMCAGGEAGIDSCTGDSGGPLIGFNIANKDGPYFYLAGIVSFGHSCGLQDWPGVYTRTGHYIDWIKSHLSP